MTSFFVLIALIKPKHTNWLHAERVRIMIVFVWITLWKWMDGLPFLHLRSPFNNGQVQENIGFEASSNFCVIFLAMTWRELLRVFGSICCVCENFFLLIVWFLTIGVVEHGYEFDSSFETTRFRGSQECLNVSHALDRCVAWKYVPLELHKSARDIVLVHECGRVPILQRSLSPMPGLQWHCFLPTHNTESENTCTSVLNRFPNGDSNRDKLIQDSVCQFCQNEIP